MNGKKTIKVRRFKWIHEAVPFGKADAQKVGEEIDALGEDKSDARIIVKARDEKTELHKCFQWDVNEAAYDHWLTTAQRIRKSLIMITTLRKNTIAPVEVEIRAFERVVQDGKVWWVDTEQALSVDELADQLIDDCLRRLRSISKKLNSYKQVREDVAQIHEGVQELIDRFEQMNKVESEHVAVV